MQMQPNAIKELQRFRTEIKPFSHLWRSFLVRAIWARLEERNIILALSITLEQKLSGQLESPKYSPEISNLHASWEAFDISMFDQFLGNLSDGHITVANNVLLVETHDNTKWGEWRSLYFQFSHPGEFPHSNVGIPMISVVGNDSMNSPVYEGIRERNLAYQLKTLAAPFENIADVLQNYIGIAYGQQDQVLISLRAELQIQLKVGPYNQSSQLCANLTIPETADPTNVSLGLIETWSNGQIHRSTLPVDVPSWRKDSDFWKLNYPLSIQGNAVKALLILKYAGIFLCQQTIIMNPVGGNAMLRIHSQLDSENTELLRCLSGQGKDPGHDFEQGVAWLFGFSGFTTHLYGLFPRFGEKGVDLIAYSRENRIILAIECGISHSQNLGKMPILVTRCRKLSECVRESGIKVIPVFATALEEVSESEKNTAKEDKIALLTQKNLIDIFEMATSGKLPQEISGYIETLIENTPNDIFGQGDHVKS